MNDNSDENKNGAEKQQPEIPGHWFGSLAGRFGGGGPEGTRSVTGKLNRFHKGSFWLAEELQAPMVPVVLHGVGHAMQKGDWLLKDASMAMRTLPTIEWNDARYGKGHRERTKAISAEFKAAYNALRVERETPRYWREKLIRTFLFKGPVLEWYVRIRAASTPICKNGSTHWCRREATVVDLGCGHGMLSYLLHWSSEDRRILGVDHDAAKVEVAHNGFSRGEALQFVHADLSSYTPPAADVFIWKDVLHYMPKEEQAALLKRCNGALNLGGMILVRDGFADDGSAHARTRTTELFPTPVVCCWPWRVLPARPRRCSSPPCRTSSGASI